MANTIRSESKRVFEYVPVGAIKFNASTGAPEAAGAATVEPTGTVSAGALTTITGLSSVANIVVGSKVSDEGQKKFFPTAAGAVVTAVNSVAKTVTVSVEAARETVVTAEATKANEGVKILFTNVQAAAAAENFTYPLESGAYASADYVAVEVNVVEANETPKLTVELETSYDGGKTWVKAEGGVVVTGELNAVGKNVTQFTLKEKVNGSQFRLLLKFGAKGSVAGYVQLATGHSPYQSR